jgi:hypothetical protein
MSGVRTRRLELRKTRLPEQGREKNKMSDDLPPSGKLINELLDQSGVSDALHDIDKAKVDRQFNSDRKPYKLQNSAERNAYALQDGVSDFIRFSIAVNPFLWWLRR